LKADRLDRRLAANQTGKRKVVVIIRERGGNSVPAVFQSDAKLPPLFAPVLPRGLW